MIENVEIRNFQSLVDVSLELGRFTVIVGPSSSGKTALIRALRGVASNIVGVAAITQGAKTAEIAVRTGTHRITLAYSKTKATGWYYIVTDLATGQSVEYTKLNRGVPEAVTRALRIAPVPTGGTSINFAGQFDPPYLLREPGAAVARTLGALTNVDTIFAAVREANRRRGGLAATLRTRELDLHAATEKAKTFLDLPAKLVTLGRADEAADSAARLSERIARLSAATDSLAAAEGVLARTGALPEVPDPAAVESSYARLTALKTLLRGWIGAENAAAHALAAVEQATAEEARLHDELHAALVAAGQCPTCGQEITDRVSGSQDK